MVYFREAELRDSVENAVVLAINMFEFQRFGTTVVVLFLPFFLILLDVVVDDAPKNEHDVMFFKVDDTGSMVRCKLRKQEREGIEVVLLCSLHYH